MTDIVSGTFTLDVKESNMSASGGPFSLNVNPATGNQLTLTPPSGALPDATEGQAYDQDVCVISGGVAPYNLSNIVGLPDDGSLVLNILSDGQTVALQGTPQVGDSDSSPYSLTFTVTDSSGVPINASVRGRGPTRGRVAPSKTNKVTDLRGMRG